MKELQAFRDAVKGNSVRLTFARPAGQPGQMKATAPQVKHIAAAYGITRQRLHQLRQLYALTLADFRDPIRVMDRLLDNGNAGSLRSRLLCPQYRAIIKNQLNP